MGCHKAVVLFCLAFVISVALVYSSLGLALGYNRHWPISGFDTFPANRMFVKMEEKMKTPNDEAEKKLRKASDHRETRVKDKLLAMWREGSGNKVERAPHHSGRDKSSVYKFVPALAVELLAQREHCPAAVADVQPCAVSYNTYSGHDWIWPKQVVSVSCKCSGQHCSQNFATCITVLSEVKALTASGRWVRDMIPVACACLPVPAALAKEDLPEVSR